MTAPKIITDTKLFCCGDLHGHYAELVDLFDTLHTEAGLVDERDTVIFLGDYVDGGPETKQVLDWCMEQDKKHSQWYFLKGNHEDLLLDALLYQEKIYGSYYLWWNQGGRETAQSFLPKDASEYDRAIMQSTEFITPEYLIWLHQRPLMYTTPEYIFVHAGLRPEVALEKQSREDMLWIRDEFIDSEYDFGKTVVYGHTAGKEPVVGFQKVCIDTMRHNKGKLTAVELGTEMRFYQQIARKGE